MKFYISFIKSILLAFIILLSSILIFSSFNYFNNNHTENIKILNKVSISINNDTKSYTLPHTFKNLDKHTKVILTGNVNLESDEVFYIKTVYSPLKIYMNDKLINSMGKKEYYPHFMKDTGTEVKLISPSITNKSATLKLLFDVPKQRDNLVIHPILMGSSYDIIYFLIFDKGLSFIFAMTLLILGLILILISIFVTTFERKGIIFTHIGLFALLSALWGLGESNISVLLIENYTLLYILSFVGLFTLTIPLLSFISMIIYFENKNIINILNIITSICIVLALLLQLTGLIQLSKSMYVFHILLPTILIILTIITIKESMKKINTNSKRFIIPISLLTIFSLLEVINYTFKLSFYFSQFFQIGIFLFILSAGVTSGLYIKDIMKLKEIEEEINFENKLIKAQITEQKKHHKLLLENEDKIKKQRHDLRHHITVIKELSNDSKKLNEYLDNLIGIIPTTNKIHCENIAINSIISYYENICVKENIDFVVKVDIAEFNENITDNYLSIIFGNLLENAVEACKKVKKKRFIHLKTIRQFDMLIITMDNSFNGEITIKNDKYFSSKRDDFGIGLSSISSIANKTKGSAKFKSDGLVFMSNIYLNLGN